jgi:cytochrome c553
MNKFTTVLTLTGALFAMTLTAPAIAGDAAAGKAKAGMCAGCHGPAGVSPQGMWPNLAGQGATYLARQLRAFKGGKERNNALMAPMVAGLTDADIDNLAAYFASLPAGTNVADGDIAVGKKLFRGGDAARSVPACMSCHGPAGKGMPSAGYPAVSGQHAAYTYAQLQGFSAGERTTAPSAIMKDIATRLTDEEMRSVAQYMAGLR